jgi:hypothetical protein
METKELTNVDDYQEIDLDLGILNTLNTYEWIGEIEREIQEN